MIPFIYLMDLVQFQPFRITLSLNLCEQIRIINSSINETVTKCKKDVDQDKDGKNIPKLESIEVVLVHCNLVKYDYQHASIVLFTFVPNKQIG